MALIHVVNVWLTAQIADWQAGLGLSLPHFEISVLGSRVDRCVQASLGTAVRSAGVLAKQI
jgi:hypothetical protein